MNIAAYERCSRSSQVFVQVHMYQTKEHSFEHSRRHLELIIALVQSRWAQPLPIRLSRRIISAETREVNCVLEVGAWSATFNHHRLCVEAKDANGALRNSVLACL